MLYTIVSTLIALLSVRFNGVAVTAQKLKANVQPLKKNDRSLQTVAVGTVEKLLLYDATTDLPLLTLADGMLVNIATLNNVVAGSLTIVATTINGPVGSVKFGYNGKKTMKNEILAPYSLCGDTGTNFHPCPYLVDGQHTITVTTYEGIKFNGTIGSVKTLTFQIVNIPPTMAPATKPTAAPIAIITTSTPTGTPSKMPTIVTAAPITTPVATPTDTPLRPPTSAPILEASCTGSIPQVSKQKSARKISVNYFITGI